MGTRLQIRTALALSLGEMGLFRTQGLRKQKRPSEKLVLRETEGVSSKKKEKC